MLGGRDAAGKRTRMYSQRSRAGDFASAWRADATTVRSHCIGAGVHDSCNGTIPDPDAPDSLSSKPLEILIIDENVVRATILEDGLRDAGDVIVHHIRDMTGLLARVAAINPDVILIDLENPSRDTLEQMFQVSRWAKRPIAMFVDRSDSDSVQAAIDAGVSAYVVDGLRRERVKSVLDVTISRFHVFNRLNEELTEARTALEERRLIEQAKGIIMQRKNLSEPEAYALLRRTAMNDGRKVADIARSLVTAASLLDKEPR